MYTERFFNVSLANVISNKNVIDSDSGFNNLKISLSKANIVGANFESITYPDYSFKMSGSLEREFSVRVFDEDNVLVTPSLFKFMLLQFDTEF